MKMQTHKIAKYFDGMIFSAEIKTRKPQKTFFEAAFETFGVSPNECIFIDDLDENVIGARECGICSFVFCGNPYDAEKFIYDNAK